MKWLMGPLLVFFVALPLAAQAPETPNPDIVVEARKREALHDFVRSMAESDRNRQLARWDREFCPEVVGVEESQAAQIESDIAQVAETLGVKARSAGCTTTMLILFDNEAPALAQALVRAWSVTLGSDGRYRLDRFAKTDNPVRWISLGDPCGFGGCGLTGSRFSKSEQPAVKLMLIIVDGTGIGSYGLHEIADYLAMVALGNPAMDDHWPDNSILSMFSRQREERQIFTLTTDDRRFLEGLYRSRPDATGQIQRNTIVDYLSDGADD